MAKATRTRRRSKVAAAAEAGEAVVDAAEDFAPDYYIRTLRQEIVRNPFASVLIAFGMGWIYGRLKGW